MLRRCYVGSSGSVEERSRYFPFEKFHPGLSAFVAVREQVEFNAAGVASTVDDISKG